ncbi:MAG: IPTL-CTERM sorting domain-containing protein [Thermoanaerobaculaceae bacterium]|jgi:hypothetical protein
MKSLRWANVAVLAFVLLATPALAAIQSTIIGTGTPPAALGQDPVTAFPADGRATGPGFTTVPTPIGGNLTFSYALTHAIVPGTWNNWSNGYTGDVYYTTGATSPDSVTITLPPGTGAFYLYTEADNYVTVSFTVTSGTASQTLNITTPSGATGVGFWDDAGGTLTSVTVSTTTSFAVGEFGIGAPAAPIPTLSTAGLVALALALGFIGLLAVRRFRA